MGAEHGWTDKKYPLHHERHPLPTKPDIQPRWPAFQPSAYSFVYCTHQIRVNTEQQSNQLTIAFNPTTVRLPLQT